MHTNGAGASPAGSDDALHPLLNKKSEEVTIGDCFQRLFLDCLFFNQFVTMHDLSGLRVELNKLPTALSTDTVDKPEGR
jgi:hypothetical protein